ncbi:MAG: prepilin-type N-terminal cleavage/methylation domain-containing protein [Candidatus Saccharimonas sp.]
MKRGFTVIELFVVIVVLCVGGWLYFNEKSTADATQRDSARKVAINAMYYNLEEVFFPKNNYYPQTIDSKTLRAMDAGLFTDPTGIKLGEADSNYRYEPTGCTTDGKCSGYTLRSSMEREADFIKKSRERS